MSEPRTVAGPAIKWDQSQMRSIYANVVHVTGTREEINMVLGIHGAWRPDQGEVTVQVLDRVLLNPHAAKRLNILLTQVLREYEAKVGPIVLEGTTGPGEVLGSLKK